jgi:protein required for attachment to host cells
MSFDMCETRRIGPTEELVATGSAPLTAATGHDRSSRKNCAASTRKYAALRDKQAGPDAEATAGLAHAVQCSRIMTAHRFDQPTWIVVANHTRATIFASCGQHLPMTVVERIENPRGHARHPLTTEESARDHGELRFATQLATMLDDKRRDHAFERLILIAEPKLLGLLRDQLSESTRRLVKLESNKDLARPTQESLRSHLPGHARV